MDKKTFALEAIKPYYKDPLLCATSEMGGCYYLLDDGRKCVLGKFLKEPELFRNAQGARSVLTLHNQVDILIPEAVDILTTDEWVRLQVIHDTLGQKRPIQELQESVEHLGLFTWEEFIA